MNEDQRKAKVKGTGHWERHIRSLGTVDMEIGKRPVLNWEEPVVIGKALEVAFDDLDYDRSGSIPRQELRSALQLIGQNPTMEDMIAYFEGTTRDGDFTKEEFFTFIEDRVTLKSRDQIDQEVAEAFEKFDDDRDFYISKDEFRRIMTKMGDEPLTEQEMDALLEGKEEKINVADIEKPDILIGTETWLSPKIKTSEFLPEGFTLHREDRSTKGKRSGGVFVMVSDKLVCAHQPQFTTKELTKLFMG